MEHPQAQNVDYATAISIICTPEILLRIKEIFLTLSNRFSCSTNFKT